MNEDFKNWVNELKITVDQCPQIQISSERGIEVLNLLRNLSEVYNKLKEISNAPVVSLPKV